MLIAAVGDIHGCYPALAKMLEILADLGLPVTFLGDYLDRGPSSIQVVDMLVKAKERHRDWSFLRGNHESMFLEGFAFTGELPGSKTAREEYLALGGLPEPHAHFLKSTQLYKRADGLFLVHGGIASRPELPAEDHAPEELMWTYEIHPEWRGPKIVRGHLMVGFPEEKTNHINLDTGCWYSGFLTAGILNPTPGVGRALIGCVQVSNDGQIIRDDWFASAVPRTLMPEIEAMQKKIRNHKMRRVAA